MKEAGEIGRERFKLPLKALSRRLKSIIAVEVIVERMFAKEMGPEREVLAKETDRVRRELVPKGDIARPSG